MKKLFLSLAMLPLFFVLPQLSFAGGCTDNRSICVNQSLPSGVKPGDVCGNSTNYVYGSTSVCFGGASPCIPRCGLGDWWCCDPKPGYTPVNKGPAAPPCNQSDNGNCLSVETGVGTISTQPANFVNSIYRILLGLAGGVALLLIIGAGYQMMTSQGNPEKVKEARERLTSAIVGLLFIIFSFTILQIIGVQILQIPGFK